MNIIHYFVDCETSGFFPKGNALLEICIVKTVNREEVARFYSKIHPHPADKIEPAALEKNGLKPSKWSKEEVLDPVVAANRIKDFFEIPSKESGDKCYLVAHNVQFDARFLRGFGKKHDVEIALPYMQIDTVQLAAAILIPLGLENHKMDTIRRFLGISSENAHTATKDVEDLMFLFALLVPPKRDTCNAAALAWCGNIAYLIERIKKALC